MKIKVTGKKRLPKAVDGLDFTFKQDDNSTMNKNALFNLQILKKLCIAFLNDVNIAKILKVSKSCIQDYRNSLNLKKNYQEYKEIKLTFEQEQVLIGGILGDSHLRKEYKNTSGEFVHSLKQKEYCSWKRDILKEFCA